MWTYKVDEDFACLVDYSIYYTSYVFFLPSISLLKDQGPKWTKSITIQKEPEGPITKKNKARHKGTVNPSLKPSLNHAASKHHASKALRPTAHVFNPTDRTGHASPAQHFEIHRSMFSPEKTKRNCFAGSRRRQTTAPNNITSIFSTGELHRINPEISSGSIFQPLAPLNQTLLLLLHRRNPITGKFRRYVKNSSAE